MCLCVVLCVCVEMVLRVCVCGVYAESVWDVRFVCCGVLLCVCVVMCGVGAGALAHVLCGVGKPQHITCTHTRNNPRVYVQNASVCTGKTRTC